MENLQRYKTQKTLFILYLFVLSLLWKDSN